MLSRFETWDPRLGSPETASILPCAQRIRLPCRLLSVAWVPGGDAGAGSREWEVHLGARMLDLESRRSRFTLWDVVAGVGERDRLEKRINRAVAAGSVCIAESDIFRLDEDGLLLRFARVWVLSGTGSGVMVHREFGD